MKIVGEISKILNEKNNSHIVQSEGEKKIKGKNKHTEY